MHLGPKILDQDALFLTLPLDKAKKCGTVFAYSNRRNSPKENDMPECKECGKSFGNDWGLRVHISRIHNHKNAQPQQPRRSKGVPEIEGISDLDERLNKMQVGELREICKAEIRKSQTLKQIVQRLMLDY